MESVKNHTTLHPPPQEGIDFNKLRVIIWNNILWVLLIFIVVNSAAYLIIRYTKDLYESVSEIKLDVKNEATELGIKTIGNDELQNADLISGEIEILRSKLFLNQVLDSINLNVSYFSKGEVLNHELFTNTPIFVTYKVTKSPFYNIPIYVEEDGPNSFVLRWTETGEKVRGTFDRPVQIPGMELLLTRNKDFISTDDIEFFFVINSRDVLLNYLVSNLAVEPLNFYAKTIRVAFKDNNPFKAQAIVQTIDSVYLAYSHEQKNLTNKQKIDWLNNELQQIEIQMEGYEDYFKKFTLQNKTSDLQEDLKKTIASINRIDSQRFEYTRRIQEVNRLNDGLLARDFLLTPALKQMLPDYLFDDLKDMQQQLLALDKMTLSYHETTFAYREKQKEIDTRIGKASQQLAELKADWLKRLQEMNRRKSSLESEFANMPDKNTQFTKNQRFYKLYEEFYLGLMQSKANFEIAQAGTTPDFKILSPATLTLRPISPNRMIILGIGLVASLVIVVFYIGFLYLVNNKITNLHELEKLSGVPVLGVVPSSRFSGSQSLHVVSHPKSMVSEAIRTIRTNLDFFRVGEAQQVIAISSTISGEGKSFVALNLGGALALSRKRVVLIDLDMRKVKTNLPMQIPDPSKGMSTVLIRKDNWRDCVVPTPVDMFDYIPSGPTPPNPSELMLNAEFATTLDDIKKNYDVVILDTPPVGLVTDGIQAMKRADISIYIFRANYSKREFLLNLQRIVSINKIENVTSLLNAMPSAGEKAYGYGYGYYEGEGNGNIERIKALFKI